MFQKTTQWLVASVVLGLMVVGQGGAARAESGTITLWEKVYQVQVEYWYWDSESYHWENYYESSNLDAAQFVYVFLEQAKQNGTLNQAAPNANWKFLAVDVRLVVVWRPTYQPRFFSDQATTTTASTDNISTRD